MCRKVGDGLSDPFVIRSLDEIRFWSRIMKEHSLFLRLGFRCEDTQLINEANQFYAIFEDIERRAHSYQADTDPETIRQFNSEVRNAASHIWAFKRKVLGLILRCQLPGETIFPCLSIMLAGKQITLEIGWRNSIAGDLNHCLMRLLMKMSFS